MVPLESKYRSHRMTPSDTWHPLDIDARDAALPSPPGRGTHVVAFLAAPDSCRTGWAARAAIRIARSWADAGADVLLADVNLESPQLHLTAGVDNREGISDALLFGSSFQRVSVPVSDGLVLAAAGTAIPDAESLRAHPRWRDFAAGFREAEALLALYLPAGAPGVDALLDLCDAAVLLAGQDESGVELPRGTRLIAAVGPRSRPGASPEPDEPEEADAGPGDVPPEEPEGAHAPPPTLEEILADGEGGQAAADDARAEPESHLPPPVHPPEEVHFRPRRPETRGESGGRNRTLFLALLALAAAVLAAGWLGWITIPGITPAREDASIQEAVLSTLPAAEAAEPGTGESTDPPGGRETGSPVDTVAGTPEKAGTAPPPPLAAFAIALASYSDLEDALRRARILSRANPEFHFLVAPVEVRGGAYYRVLAGSAADPDEAVALRDRLGAVLPGSGQWILRQAGMAYLLGALPDLDSAQLAVEDLQEKGIPAHILRVDGGPRGPEFRVYSGAYASAAEARFMEEFLRERGIPDAVLTQRRGVVPG